jgi:general secretion pathway protein E/type IV pilus assembly protein PilB
MTSNDEYIIEILKDIGLLKTEDIARAQQTADEEHKSVLDVLIDMGVLSKMEVLKTVAMHIGMDVVVLAELEIPREVIDAVPSAIARRYKIVPVSLTENTLTVALSDPLNIETLDSLRYILKRNVEGVVASDEEIDIALDHYYGRVERSVEEIIESSKSADQLSISAGDNTEEGAVSDSDAPIIKLVHLVILEAQRSRASDIHLEPLEKRF